MNGVRVDGGNQALDVVTDWTVTVGDLFGDGQEDADMFNSAAGEVLWDFTIIDGQFTIVEYRDAGAAAAAAAGVAGSRTVQAGEAQPRTR